MPVRIRKEVKAMLRRELAPQLQPRRSAIGAGDWRYLCRDNGR